MGRELKQDEAPVSCERVLPAPFDAARFAQDVHAAQLRVRRFEIVDSRRVTLSLRGPAIVSGIFAIVALIVAVLVRSVVLRTLLPLALAAAATFVLLRAIRARRKSRAKPARAIWFDGRRLVYQGRTRSEQTLLVSTAAPFGVTLLANRHRQRVVAAISSADGAFYIGATFDASMRRVHANQLARTSTVTADEVALAAIGPDGESLDLHPADWVALVNELARVSPACLDRVVLSDARGAPVLLEQQELRVRDVRFDLSLPLEWRALVFQEPFGQAVAVYQGTWVRQGVTEVVLVALLPSIAAQQAADPQGSGIAELDRVALRDLRLMQASPERPPPNEQRVAIDRLFMLPLRTALDRAPRPSHQSSRARA